IGNPLPIHPHRPLAGFLVELPRCSHTGILLVRSQSPPDPGRFTLLTDLAGAPTELLDPITGTVTTTLFGTTRTTGTTTPHRFTGQTHDPETGLHYNRHRYYNPHTTTYTTPDPLGQAPNPDSNHAYVHNPLTWVDPLGFASMSIGHTEGRQH
ncbi:MAG: RHS repeat-associated core domain-containing protein, partial [Rhodococcus sp. (in: high G+C Gram-positive bacteria)]